MLEEQVKQLGELLMFSGRTMALTGAGISLESGIPTFRGMQGLWEKYDIMEYATIDAFRRDPVKVWKMLLEMDRAMMAAQPNPGHTALAELEQMGLLHMIVTQNVDNLHQEAGSREVVEFHGNVRQFRCLDCRQVHEREKVDLVNLPPRCHCGGLIKPDAIFFGEAIPWAANIKAFEMAQQCRLIMVIGTSAVVAPASEIPVMAKQSGAMVVEVNPEETILTGRISDTLLKGSSAAILPMVVEYIKGRRQ